MKHIKYKGVVNPFGDNAVTVAEPVVPRQGDYEQSNDEWIIPDHSERATGRKPFVQYTDEQKNRIKAHHSRDIIEGYLQKAPRREKGNPTFVCPICGNGSGTSGTGAVISGTKVAGYGLIPHLFCFKCYSQGDKRKGVIDAIRVVSECEKLSYRDTMELLLQRYPECQ